MSSHDAIAAVISALESEGIAYMMVGAFSSNAYGIPRSTNDADVVVKLGEGDLTRLMESLGEDFQLDRQLRLETITHTVRNVVTFLPTAFDIELFRLSEDPHDEERFRRRTRHRMSNPDCEIWIPTAEDVILQKLRWARRKDIDDARNVLAVCFETLDCEYMSQWASRHDTADLLQQLKAEVQSIGD